MNITRFTLDNNRTALVILAVLLLKVTMRKPPKRRFAWRASNSIRLQPRT